MSTIKKPIMLNETGQIIAEQLTLQNSILTALASGVNYKPTSIKDVVNVVRGGKAQETFQIGDQIVIPWKDVTTGVEYSCPLDVISFPTATLQDGEELPAMRVQWHYATPFGVQFNNYQAFYYCEEALAPGTYYIEIGSNWGSNCASGKKYQFTLTKQVPAGGQLAGFRGAPDTSPSNWRVYSYSSKTASDALETVALSEGSSGTSLGVLKTGGDGNLNCLQRVAYGYNRWAQSALRQWLNSDAEKGSWWTPQNNYDRCPDQLSTKAGFLTGFEDEFKEILRAVKVNTALNTITDYKDTSSSPLEVTYDKFFPLALEQMNINPQLSGEGDVCEYWKRASQMSGKMAQYGTYPQIRTYAIENHTSPQLVRLRSANRGLSNNTWLVSSSGYVNTNNAVYAYRCTPACDLC